MGDHSDIDHTGLTGVGGGTPDAHAASHESGGSDEIDVTGLTGAGGGGGGWDLGIDKDGTSFSGCTGESGTWASNSTVIQQTATGAAHKKMHFNTLVPHGVVVVEADIKIVAAGGVASAAGILIGHPGSDLNGAAAVFIRNPANDVQWENLGIAAVRNVSQTVNTGTFYTVRIVHSGQYQSVYFNGTLIETARNPGSNASGGYIGLGTYDATADFRNVKVWTLTQP